jgi:ATP-binding cassette subfamily B protein
MKILFRNIKRAFGYAWAAYPGLIVGLVVMAILQAVLPYLTSNYLGKMVNKLVEISQGADIASLWTVLGIYVAIRLLRPVVGALWNYFDQVFFLKFQMKIDLMVMERRAAFDIARYEDATFLNKLDYAFKRGYWPVVNLVDRSIGVIEPIAGAILGIAIAAAFDWRIFVIIVTLSIPSFITNFKYGRQVWGIWAENSEDSRRLEDLGSHMRNRFNIVELKMFQGTRYFINWMKRILLSFNDKQQKAESDKARNTVGTEVLAAIGSAISIIMIVRSTATGETDIGTMTFLIASIAIIQDTVTDFFIRLARILDDNQYATDIFAVLDTPPIVKESAVTRRLELDTPPEIVLENVSFKYEGQEGYVLKNLNLTIPAGTKLGLVGNNGAGKTTLIRLICRIYDPSEGRILINGIDLKEYKIEDWRSALGVLFQDFSSYDFVTKDSIAVGRTEEPMSIERVKHAAALSESSEFIERWENTYDQQIGVEFGGVDPSKGQKQKLALARVLYRDPAVLILDEPTAAVDAESEAKIFERIETISRAVTAILISHRFSTVKRADIIVVLEYGQIIEQGTHDQLMEKNGRYSELFNTQLEGYTR